MYSTMDELDFTDDDFDYLVETDEEVTFSNLTIHQIIKVINKLNPYDDHDYDLVVQEWLSQEINYYLDYQCYKEETWIQIARFTQSLFFKRMCQRSPKGSLII